MQSVSHLLMIKPSHFGFNVETAANNYFQQNIILKNSLGIPLEDGEVSFIESVAITLDKILEEIMFRE